MDRSSHRVRVVISVLVLAGVICGAVSARL